MNNSGVSIIMPCYNVGEWVKTAVESALNQDIPVQLIAVDDSSTDNTLDVLSSFSADIMILQSANKGVAHARNTAIKHINSPYTLLLDADDALAPDILKHLVSHIKPGKHEVVYGDFSSWDPAMVKRLHLHKAPILGKEPLSLLVNRNISPPGAIIFPTNAFSRIGDFDQSVAGCEDWDFIIRMARAGYKFRKLNREILYYRRRYASASNQANKMLASGLEVIRRAYNRDSRVTGDRYADGYSKAGQEASLFNYYGACMGLASLYTDPDVFKGILQSVTIPGNVNWTRFGEELRQSIWWNSFAVSGNRLSVMLQAQTRGVSLIKQVAREQEWCRDMIMGILSPDFRQLLLRPGPKKALRLYREWKLARQIYEQLDI